MHKTLFFVRDRMGAHNGYDIFRSAAELLEANGAVPAPPDEDSSDDEAPAGSGAADPAALAAALGTLLGGKFEALQARMDARFDDLSARLSNVERALARPAPPARRAPPRPGD